jgi:hypothetical protein
MEELMEMKKIDVWCDREEEDEICDGEEEEICTALFFLV